jgi:hypothetical protein
VRRVALLVTAVALLATTACDSGRVDPLEEFASASCASVQTWVDAVEDAGTQLSNAVIKLDTARERQPYYGIFARALHERADDLVRQLRHIAPLAGDGRDAADLLIAAIQNSEAVTSELITTADAFPKSNDAEDTYARVSLMFVGNEKAFSYATRAVSDLSKRYPAFADARSCVDYRDPVT